MFEQSFNDKAEAHSLILAREIDQFLYDFDPYEYNDQLVGSREDNIDNIRADLEAGNVEHMIQMFMAVMEENSPDIHTKDQDNDLNFYNKAKELMEDIKNYIALNNFLKGTRESSWIERKIEEQTSSSANSTEETSLHPRRGR